MKEEFIDFKLDERDIEHYLYVELLREGLVPESDEIQIIASIVFDYIIDFLESNGFIGETILLDEEDE